jgi:hypothetical protein
MPFTRFAYDPTDNIANTTSFPTTPSDETAARAQFKTLLDQILVAVNGLMTQLESTDAGDGAASIGSEAISGVTGTTVRAQISDLYTQIQNLIIGEIDPATILTTGSIDDTAMLADDVVTGAKIPDESIDSDHYVDGSIDEAHLSTGCVTEDKHAAGSVTATKIGTGAVTKAKANADLIALIPSLSDGTALTTGQNLNSITLPGNYIAAGSVPATLGNTPTTKLFNMYVAWPMDTSGWVRQIVITYDGDIIQRYSDSSGTSWSAWVAYSPVFYGTSATPPAGSYPVGTIYIQYVA